MGSLGLEASQSTSKNSCTCSSLNMIAFITIKNPGLYQRRYSDTKGALFCSSMVEKKALHLQIEVLPQSEYTYRNLSIEKTKYKILISKGDSFNLHWKKNVLHTISSNKGVLDAFIIANFTKNYKTWMPMIAPHYHFHSWSVRKERCIK